MRNKPIPRAAVRGRRARPPRRVAWCFAAGIVAQSLVGCGSPSTFQFDRLDISPARESFTEFSLGRYEIPVPIANDRTNDHGMWTNRLLFQFELYALVAPDEASQLADNWQRHEGKIRDQVIRVCRNASLDELQEPELATLKARLMDAMQGQLGEREVRRLLMTEVVSQQL
ncbi:MAG: flagellar basal body-associated FliL family protein [Pirellulales bacterium]